MLFHNHTILLIHDKMHNINLSPMNKNFPNCHRFGFINLLYLISRNITIVLFFDEQILVRCPKILMIERVYVSHWWETLIIKL